MTEFWEARSIDNEIKYDAIKKIRVFNGHWPSLEGIKLASQRLTDTTAA